MFTSPDNQAINPLSQDLLVSVLNSLGDGVIVTDGEGRVMAMNRMAVHLTGLPLEIAQGQLLSQVLCLSHPQQNNLLGELMQRVLSEGLSTGLPRDTRLVRPDGLDYLSATLAPLGGKHRGLVVTFREVNRHRQLEDSLREQAQREHLVRQVASRIHRSLELGTILQTAVTEIRLCLQVERVFVCRFLRDDWGEVLHESVAATSRSLLGQRWQFGAGAEMQSLRQGQVVAITDLGQSIGAADWLVQLQRVPVGAALVTPIFQGERLWGILAVTDALRGRAWAAGERQLVEQLALQLGIAIDQAQLVHQLRTLNSTLEMQVAERTTEVRQALNAAQVLHTVTEQVRRSLDEGQIFRTALDCLGQNLGADYCWVALYDEAQIQAMIAYEYLQSPTLATTVGSQIELSQHRELYQRLLDGEVWHYPPVELLPPVYAQFRVTGGQMVLAPIMDDQGVMGELGVALARPQQGVQVDLVPQVANQCAIAIRQARLYQQSRAQVLELERLHRLKDDFLSTVSHELRTPLSNMKLALKMLGLSLRKGNINAAKMAKLLQYLDILEQEYQREVQLIQDLLNLRQLDTAQQPLPQVTLDMQQWVPGLLTRFQHQVEQKGLHLTCTLDPELPQIAVHLFSLERIVTELLTNAVKYTPTGGTIHLATQKLPHHWQLEVTNTGVEIPPQELQLIFERFYRVPRSDPWQHGGMGLGLALVQRLVAHLGGTIAADSSQGQTQFRVVLPLNGGNDSPI
ncbi:two-component sensor histidine kinase [Gloeomargarita lithophora Alchichica-D10]|uniref:histidine kinase n=1 Tax=Gloeomargarita lithophora Alchichica-D10 TaxID=1188229 RepID=A0A1J0ACB9_9CYAN|nr:GAF domain-containing sensor histidine kinase [Gloeomargarita lithophora]APB33596.1 two-component sensor histidine kinase [Gloeomargarita lithophora Alchichica-D10]